jgi:hypothetical protein
MGTWTAAFFIGVASMAGIAGPVPRDIAEGVARSVTNPGGGSETPNHAIMASDGAFVLASDASYIITAS